MLGFFRVTFSQERKSERIERKFETKNPNLSWSMGCHKFHWGSTAISRTTHQCLTIPDSFPETEKFEISQYKNLVYFNSKGYKMLPKLVTKNHKKIVPFSSKNYNFELKLLTIIKAKKWQGFS